MSESSEAREAAKEQLESAILAARAAGAELKRRFHEPRTIKEKTSTHDLVTDADTAAEAELLAVLKRRHPNDAILAEESGASGTAANRWIVDPLDGTTNYAHAIPHFCVSIGYEVSGTRTVGVIFDPLRDELFAAVRGQGATLNGTPLKVSGTSSLSHAVLATGFPYWVSEKPEIVTALFDAFVAEAQAIRRFGSAALDLAWVAAGRYDAFFELGLKPWDIAAGSLIVDEAGGRSTDIDGAALGLGGESHILASNTRLHAPILAIAQRVRAKTR